MGRKRLNHDPRLAPPSGFPRLIKLVIWPQGHVAKVGTPAGAAWVPVGLGGLPGESGGLSAETVGILGISVGLPAEIPGVFCRNPLPLPKAIKIAYGLEGIYTRN